MIKNGTRSVFPRGFVNPRCVETSTCSIDAIYYHKQVNLTVAICKTVEVASCLVHYLPEPLTESYHMLTHFTTNIQNSDVSQ